jgi:hypothetical protein
MLFGRLIDEYSSTTPLNKAEVSSVLEFRKAIMAQSEISIIG